MYNVEPYLPDFFRSLENQSYGIERLQIVLIDDGSTDGTLALAEQFRAKYPHNVTVLTKPNGGQASARNLGLTVAEGEWLTFPDPDDVLSEGYFAEVERALGNPQSVDLAVVSTRILLWFDGVNQVKDTHALGGRFRSGARFVDLDSHPQWIQPHVTSAFIRASVVEETQLSFPENLRLRFEDGNFISRYLLRSRQRKVLFLPSAEYLYRQRADQSSTIQSSAMDPRKYTDTIRYGFMGVIDEARSLGAPVPRWAQNLFLYDQFWILRSSQTPAVRQAEFPEWMHEELNELVPRFLEHVEDELILSFGIMPVAPWMRQALWLVKHGVGHTEVYEVARDRRRGLRALLYRFSGERPSELVRAGGRAIQPRHSKTQPLEYVGRPLIWQRTLWVPDDVDIEIELNGDLQDPPRLRVEVPVDPYPTSGLAKFRRNRVLRRVVSGVRRRVGRGGTRLLVRDLTARLRLYHRTFSEAWVFIDRDVDANDSAEDMYWWVRENHPEINAWFVLRRDSNDWKRMSQRGARLVEYGSARHFALLLNAKHLASSHADRFITDVLPSKWGPVPYVFTFLQHGVIKGDLSLWLNPKVIDLFITSTQDEYDYIVGTSPYRYGTKEVRLTGLPRFDALLSASERVAESERNIILFAPTWRSYLVGSMAATSADRTTVDSFEETSYARAISSLLSSDELVEGARVRGKRIVFMPHPNMQPYLDQFAVSPDIEVMAYADVDIRDVLARTAVCVTDYSSIAFNTAFLHVPTVYFQFDRDEYFSGHTERKGYFDYETHGFGPVVETVDRAVSAVMAAIDGELSPIYSTRVERAFPVRDGRNRERVFEAMQEAARRRDMSERTVAATPDSWGARATTD